MHDIAIRSKLDLGHIVSQVSSDRRILTGRVKHLKPARKTKYLALVDAFPAEIVGTVSGSSESVHGRVFGPCHFAEAYALAAAKWQNPKRK